MKRNRSSWSGKMILLPSDGNCHLLLLLLLLTLLRLLVLLLVVVTSRRPDKTHQPSPRQHHQPLRFH
jgi:hypothetical protein